MATKKELRGQYILNVLHNIELAGDAYSTAEELYQLCKQKHPSLSEDAFRADKTFLQKEGRIAQEGRRIYLAKTLAYENAAAQFLADILSNNELQSALQDMPASTELTTLTGEQQSAIRMVFGHRLSLILGGAGTGKTTLVRGLIAQAPHRLSSCILCAPTGKVARNLTERTGVQARTVHGALGLRPEENFLGPVHWDLTGLVVIDEASMMTLEMLAGILHKVSPFAHVVLIGDPNQLLSVGAGNVLTDLLALGVPCTQLTICHRQSAQAAALGHNVRHFQECRSLADLRFDNSFYFVPQTDEKRICQAVCCGGAKLYRMGGSTQVLSPFRSSGKLSVSSLNDALRDMLNPAVPANQNPDWPDACFREGDRVMVLENDWQQMVCNGDVGHFYFLSQPGSFGISCPGQRRACWIGENPSDRLSLAYAITVHKAQGSEYDMVILPLVKSFGVMLTRNLLYTAISRARKHVVLVGDPDALEEALRQEPKPRKSQLVAKARMCCVKNDLQKKRCRYA